MKGHLYAGSTYYDSFSMVGFVEPASTLVVA